MHRFSAFLCTAALAVSVVFCTLAAPASAAVVVFDDDFDEFGSLPQLAFSGLTQLDNFSVVSGTIDVFTNLGDDLSCPSNACIDLGGSSLSDLRMETVDLNLTSGVDYTLSLHVSGNQREPDVDLMIFGLNGTNGLTIFKFLSLFSSDAFQTVSLDFFVSVDTVAKIFIEHEGADFAGIILDRVTLTANNVSTVPLPGALPLLALGLAGLGVLKRRRRWPVKVQQRPGLWFGQIV